MKRFFTFLSLILLDGNLNASEVSAFSLKVAQQRIASIPSNQDYRKYSPGVFTLGGIIAIKGLVYDHATEDVIIVGEKDTNRTLFIVLFPRSSLFIRYMNLFEFYIIQ